MPLTITGQPDADALLSADPFALLVGMLLDQQMPMERAFAGPARLRERLGGFDVGLVAGTDPAELARICAVPPAVHRYPAAMAARISALAVHVRDRYDGDAAAVWRSAADGADLRHRLQELPGYGPHKAQILVALLGKQLGVQPRGWQDAAGGYGEPDVFRSVADVVDAASLAKVRAYKQDRKRSAGGTRRGSR